MCNPFVLMAGTTRSSSLDPAQRARDAPEAHKVATSGVNGTLSHFEFPNNISQFQQYRILAA